MPRRARLYQKGIPCHIIQRGNNRCQCFFNENDYKFYLKVLYENLKKYKVKLHAFVLMTNHTHLLMTPSDHTGISNVMKIVGIRYVRYINGIYHRTGTLWEGRHKACLIDSEQYLMHCYRYIELNPLRANMVNHPKEYKWSSYNVNALGKVNNYIEPHSEYLSLGKDDSSRQRAYKALFNHPLTASMLNKIRESVKHNYPFGSDEFKLQIENKMNVKLGQMKQGRPTGKCE